MTSRQFLNLAYAVLVEEFQRPKLINGMNIPGLSLDEALKIAAQWAEGYVYKPGEDLAEAESQQPGSKANGDYQSDKRELTEEEMIAKNNAALAWLERRLSGVSGGLGKFAHG